MNTKRKQSKQKFLYGIYVGILCAGIAAGAVSRTLYSHFQPTQIVNNQTTSSPIILPTISKISNEDLGQPLSLDVIKSTTTKAVEDRFTNASDINDCQPDLFDPNTTKYEKEPRQEISPEGLYQLKNSVNGTHFQINGWYKKDENIINIKSPYTLTFYRFGCASTFSYVLEIKKSGSRYLLYTHVRDFQIDKANTLYIDNYLNQNNQWIHKKRIIDVQTKVEHPLPLESASICTQKSLPWSEGFLITYSNDSPSSVCIWNTKGELQNQPLVLNFEFGSFSENALVNSVGIVPLAKNMLYYVTHKNEKTCSLYIATYIGEVKVLKRIDLVENWEPGEFGPYCNISIDPGSVSLQSKNIRYHEGTTPTTVWKNVTVSEANSKTY